MDIGFSLRTAVVGIGLALLVNCSARAGTSAEVFQRFAQPSADYAVAPLWVLSDKHTEQEMRDRMQDMADQKVMQVIVHPRPGLVNTYLTDEWFGLWEAALDEGKRLGMNVWIYDENSYPSGFAGGHVYDQMPESRGRGVSIKEAEEIPAIDADLLGVYRIDGDTIQNVTDQAKAGTLGKDKYLVASVVHAPPQPWNGDGPYVDLMYPGVTQKFLEITLEPYRARFGNEFGKRIPGVFTDEPELQPAGAPPWTPDLPEQFEKQWGYSLIDNLPCLVRDVGDFKKVRHDYLFVCNKLFIERWSKPYYEYCEKYDLDFTGHYWEHEWPRCLRVPDNMAMYAWHQRPAIDNLFINYGEHLHSQFGNSRTVKELSSVANQLGRERTLCEAYGAGGWECRFEDMKRIGDWLYALGVNTLDPHLSYLSIRGARKHDHPQSFSYHAPWWEAYHISAEYFARLSAALSAGKQINDVLLIEPTTTVWMYNSEPPSPARDEIGSTFEAMIRLWEQNQIEYDLGCEDIIARHGSVEAATKEFVVGRGRYKVVVLPARTETLNGTTVELLEKFVAAGGSVMCCGEAPALVDARPSERLVELAEHDNWMSMPEDKAMAAVRGRQWAAGMRISPVGTQPGMVFHHRRVLDDGELLFLVNIADDKPAFGSISTTRARGVEEWDPATGEKKPFPARHDGKKLEIVYGLEPCGSLLLFLSDERRDTNEPPKETRERVAAATGLEIRRLDPNVLVLDYCDVTCGGETKTGVNARNTANWIFAKHGAGDRNPWDRAVQFKDRLISRTFLADSGFEATYRFAIEGQVPTPLFAVVERPDLYSITCNGKPVAAPPNYQTDEDGWWIDKQFGKIDIASVVQPGVNTLTIKASPMTMFHELASAYVIGDFAIEPAAAGFKIVAEEPMRLGPWNEQGYWLYGHRVGYRQSFDVAGKNGRYEVEVPDWHGSVVKVVVNGKTAGYFGWPPYKLDITDQIAPGANEVEVVVFGTLRNTLGPSHWKKFGLIGPGHWDPVPANGPPAGTEYVSVGYGMFEPFKLTNIAQVKH